MNWFVFVVPPIFVILAFMLVRRDRARARLRGGLRSHAGHEPGVWDWHPGHDLAIHPSEIQVQEERQGVDASESTDPSTALDSSEPGDAGGDSDSTPSR